METTLPEWQTKTLENSFTGLIYLIPCVQMPLYFTKSLFCSLFLTSLILLSLSLNPTDRGNRTSTAGIFSSKRQFFVDAIAKCWLKGKSLVFGWLRIRNSNGVGGVKTLLKTLAKVATLGYCTVITYIKERLILLKCKWNSDGFFAWLKENMFMWAISMNDKRELGVCVMIFEFEWNRYYFVCI